MEISHEQWKKVKEIYEAALDCSPLQRTAYVNRQTKDELVCAEVLRLLSESDSADSFLSTPPFVDRRNIRMEIHERLEEGKLLSDRFRIISFIAAGGMGEVYKAEDIRLGRTVVLKFLPKELTEDAVSLERFRQEAKAASALNHPNICTVYDFGQDAGRAFIAMEYLEGETLSSRLKSGPLPLKHALKSAIEVCSALNAAHRMGIIHRDIKPGNIMLTASGAKLLDFGLAKCEKALSSIGDVEDCFTADAAVVGTLSYMSPEQLRGKDVDASSDIFSFGTVLYEMLTARRALRRKLRGNSVVETESGPAQSIRELMKGVPNEVEALIQRCLQTRPTDRYQSLGEVQHILQDSYEIAKEPVGGVRLRALLRQMKRPLVGIPLLVGLLAAFGGLAYWIHHSRNVAWAKDQALPRISELVQEGKILQAYNLAVEAERYIPQDPALQKMWPDISWSEPLFTSPAGALLYKRNYNDPTGPWEFVGRTPIQNKRFPAVDLVWKFELNGFTTLERTTTVDRSSLTFGSLTTIRMFAEGAAPAGMVPVGLTDKESKSIPVHLYGLPGYETLPPVSLTDFWIDRFEVTNAEYKRFVDDGGYKKREYWKQEFRRDGRALSWAEAMSLFVDQAGKSGPAQWREGQYPAGEDNYPVTGISWFEAAAYAEFLGKSLPTMYHWRIAAFPQDGPTIIPASNFSGSGPAPAGAYRGVSWSGVYDMAGNVREWVYNEGISGKRYSMGGAWNEPTYAFNFPEAHSPFERSSNIGFRCAKYVLDGESTKAADPIRFQPRDFSKEKPASDQVFEIYKSLYSYDKTPLNTVVESSQHTEGWTLDKIAFDAAYGKERVMAYLFLPKNVKPPFQTVVYFPGAAALLQHSSENEPQLEVFDFVIRSGRAVMFPVYKGTYERFDDYFSHSKMSTFYRDTVIDCFKDLGRSVDYLETRPDIDPNKLAYEGDSWGAAMGAILPAMEDRFKALVLIGPGFWLEKRFPAADQINFAPRVKTPVLMLNGKYDYIFPPGPSQEPMFRLLGTPVEHKRRLVYATGHDVPRSEMIKETLSWLDRYLGPVNRTQSIH